MEKRLRSTLQSSAEEFLSSALNTSLKSSLKTLIYSVPSSSPLSSSIPPSLHLSISRSVSSFRNLLLHCPPSSPASPPSKRPRRSSRKVNSNVSDSSVDHERHKLLDELRIQADILLLCVSHPGNSFSAEDLLPAARLLHDNLILLESDTVLVSRIANLCEYYWKENLTGREMLISQFLPFLVSKSLTLKKKVDVHRVYALREGFTLFDFEDESIEDLKLLLIRCVIAPLYLKTEEGRKFLGFMFGLSGQLMKEALAMIKSQIPFGRKSILEAYGEILFRAWKGVEGYLKDEIENGFLQGLIESAVHANSREFAASIRRMLGGFVCQKITNGVEKLLFRLAEPVIFRSLQVANSNVRLNALHLLLDLFPLEDPDATKEVKDTLLDRQLFLMEKLLMDDSPEVRIVAVEGCCRVLHLFWEIIPSSTITKILTKIFDDMTHDICFEVRLSTLHGVVYLLGNPQSHEILKVLLPRVGHLILDNVLSVRIAVVDLLLLIRDIRTFQFNKVVSLDELLSTLAKDQHQVAQKITRLLVPSYFPSKVSIEDACHRCITLIKRSPMGGARFCEFAVLEGSSPKYAMELVKALISSVLSSDKMNTGQIEGIFAAAAYLCNNLVNEPSYVNTLKELFSAGKAKCLFSAACTRNSRSSVLNILSTVSPDDVASFFEECMLLVTNCSGLLENVEMQVEVRSAHKLLLSFGAFDEMLEALTRLLQKTAYRCHVKFGTEISKQRISPGKRGKCMSSSKISVSAKWKHVSRKNASNFEEDYSIAVGIAWQIIDLLSLEETQKALLDFHALELPFLALKVISEVSVGQCMCCEYMDIYPVLAYTALAFHMNLQNITTSSTNDCSKKNGCSDSSTSISEAEQTELDRAADHLLNCAEKLLEASSNISSGSTMDNSKTRYNRESHRKPQTNPSSSNDDGTLYSKEKKMQNMVKMLTAVLKFIVDSLAMGFLSQIQLRCLKFTSEYVKYIIICLGQESSEKLQFKDGESKEIINCLKSSFSYAAKLLNLILSDANGTLSLLLKSVDLANNMLDLIISVELYMGSVFAARLVAVAKHWLPDLILALGPVSILKQNETENTYLTVLHHIKLYIPSWSSTIAKNELCELNEDHQEEEDRVSETEDFPVFKKFTKMMVSLLKGAAKILDAFGVIFLAGVVVGLERKDFRLVLGLLHFVCVQLVGQEDKEWNELDTMLSIVPEIYPQIEREVQEQEDEDNRQRLQNSRALLEPIWLYHVYETGRFSLMEE